MSPPTDPAPPVAAAPPTDSTRSRTPTVAVLGAGVVGARVARELTSGGSHRSVELHSARSERRTALAKSFGASAVVLAAADDRLEAVGDAVEVVVLSGSDASHPSQARLHLAEGRHVVSTADSPATVTALLELDEPANEAGLSVVAGCAFSPGLSCLLAAHASASLDAVDEIQVSRHGAGGPACASRRLRSHRDEGMEWRDGTWWRRRSGGGREIAWFPDPIGGRDCYRVSSAEPLLLVDSFPHLHRCAVRGVMNRRDKVARYAPVVLPAPDEGGIGAVRVEVRGRVGSQRRTIVLGALDRPGVAAAALVAEAVLGIRAGCAPTGAHGMAAWSDPAEVLRSLRLRGIRVATLSGV